MKLENGEERPFHLPKPVIPVLPFSQKSIGNPWVVVQLWEDASRMLQFYSRIDPEDWVPLDQVQRLEPDDEILEQEDNLRRTVLARVEQVLSLMAGAVAGAKNPSSNPFITVITLVLG